MSLLALQDLFRRYRDRNTGVWKLGEEPSRTIFFDYGDTVFAQSTHLQDRLTTIMVEKGRITQTQMDYALANLKPGISIGKNLIEMGFITQRDLLDMAKVQVERIVFGCLAQPDVMPVFEARELDAHVVRLPMNTAQLFLSGILAIQDRGWLLELLGPLNQVVVLQGKSLQDLTLPPDLAKLAALLDGTHTLLELSRESQAEPMRVGAFALFLREMGWARLHEMPPMDRHALDRALSPDPEPLSAPLEEAQGEPVPSLFETIQEAARPTTNLEHLSQALDQEIVTPETPPEPLSFPEGLLLPEFPEPDPGVHVESGQAQMPTPSVELPPLEEPEAEVEPRVTLRVPLEEPSPLPLPPSDPEAPPSAPILRWVMVGILLVACTIAGVLRMRRRAVPTMPPPKVAPPAPPAPAREPVPSIAVPPAPIPPPAEEPRKTEPEPPRPEPAREEPRKPEPVREDHRKPEPVREPHRKSEPTREEKRKEEPSRKPTKAPRATIPDRLASLAKGDLDTALAQGAERVKEAPSSHWALRLEIACQGDTIRRVSQLFGDEKPDIFLLPIVLKDGRSCYQVLYGNFPSREAAEKAAKHLPPAFMADRNRPKAFRFADIPGRQ